MMRLIKYILTGVAVIAFAGCTDLDLQPLSQASTETWYTDQTQVEMSLNTLYLHQFWPIFKNDLNRSTMIMALDEATDDWTNRNTLTIFTNGKLTSDNSNFVKGVYENSYKAISRCNSIINNIDRAQANISDEFYERYIADAKFVRACMYGRLICYFGDVVYFTIEPTLEESYTMTRTKKEIVLQGVYEDFDYAIEKLPDSYTGTEIKRATKGAAYGMKARIALFFKDYEVAKVAAQKCMELDVYELYPDFGELFLSSTKNSVETVFGIPRSTEYGTSLNSGAITAYLSRNITSPSCTATPSWDLLCAYLCTDGLPIDESPLYDRQDPFKNRDPRCAYTIVALNSNYLGFNYTPHPDSATCWNYTSRTKVTNKDSKASDQYASFNGLILRKGVDQDWVDNLEADNDKLIIRFADILLMYAEARIELNEIDQSVLDAINMVRARAYKVDYTSDLYPKVTTTDQTALRTILRTERRMEFAFEGLRYNDIIRWEIAEKVMNYKNFGLPTNAASCRTYIKNGYWFLPGIPQIDEDGCPICTTMTNYDKCRILSKRVFDKNKHYLWPIPAEEQLLNPKLGNNPGY